jgi:hypothetical protein
MKSHRYLSALAVACLATLVVSEAAATANLGGTVSVLAGSGSCHDNNQVPGNTLQDTFALSGATACSGGSASADLHAEAATGTIGLRASSAGNGFGSSNAAAQVQFTDYWLLNVPTGTASGTFINIPVSIHLDGSVTPGAVFDASFGRFLDYNLTISDHYTTLSPGGSFSAFGRITSSGIFSQTFNGSVNFFYWGPGSLPTRADVEMTLFLVSLFEGTVDFYNTARISLDLPPGFSATTSSGLPLQFAAVPEPETYAMLLAGLGLLGFVTRRRKLQSA